MSQYLDRCDLCNKPKHCRGYKGMVLCDECIGTNKAQIVYPKKTIEKDTLTIFDFIEVTDEKG